MEHTIKSGNAIAAVSDLGGTVRKLTRNGTDILFPYRMVGDGKSRGGLPLCAPWFGSSPRGPKKHGFLRDSRPCERMISNERAALAYFLPGTDGYPWSLKCVTMTHIYREYHLQFMLRMERMLDGIHGAAPVCPAFHPYFPFRGNETRVIIGEHTFTGFPSEGRCIPLNGQRWIVVRSPQQTIEIELLGDFENSRESQVVLWSDSPETYVCVEPVLGSTAFDTARGRYLREGESCEVSMVFHI